MPFAICIVQTFKTLKTSDPRGGYSTPGGSVKMGFWQFWQ